MAHVGRCKANLRQREHTNEPAFPLLSDHRSESKNPLAFGAEDWLNQAPSP